MRLTQVARPTRVKRGISTFSGAGFSMGNSKNSKIACTPGRSMPEIDTQPSLNRLLQSKQMFGQPTVLELFFLSFFCNLQEATSATQIYISVRFFFLSYHLTMGNCEFSFAKAASTLIVVLSSAKQFVSYCQKNSFPFRLTAQ